MRTIYEDAEKIFVELVEIDSPSLKEKKMADHIRELFRGLGVALTEDQTAEVTGSDAGNLYGCVKGGKEGRRTEKASGCPHSKIPQTAR